MTEHATSSKLLVKGAQPLVLDGFVFTAKHSYVLTGQHTGLVVQT
jgi:hypothetical protein